MNFQCQHSNICSICKNIGTPLVLQQQNKAQNLKGLLKEHLGIEIAKIPVHDLGPGGLRTRVDLTFENGKLGFYTKTDKKIFQVEECPQLSSELQRAFAVVAKVKFPIKKGSLRIRVSPENNWGLWLDFSNIDIKNLLEEAEILKKLLKEFSIEIGQKRKTLIYEDHKLKLKEDRFSTWNEAYDYQLRPHLLHSKIGTFSQTGPAATKKITELIVSALPKSPLKIAEFGGGIGSFSIALLGKENSLQVYELDEEATAAFKETIYYSDRLNDFEIDFHVGDFQKYQDKEFLHNVDLIFANPARSGVGDFFRMIPPTCKHVFYLSCFAESFLKDSRLLINKGFTLSKLEIIDQFPQTDHYEIFSVWTPKPS